VPVIIAPYPDSVFSEETVHLSMLAHSLPENVLVLSGGAGGVLNEILKYRIKKIDYAEMDPLIIKTLSLFPTQMTESELKNSRVNVNFTDGRLFLKQTDSSYDMIYVGLNNPSDLQVNRLFTKEFYQIARKKLNAEGIFVTTLPGSLSYLDKSLVELNDTVIDTLKSVFQNVRVIPGDFNIIWASDSNRIFSINADTIIKNFLTRRPPTNVLTVPHIKYKLQKRWTEWFDSVMEIEKENKRINADFHPGAVFYSLSYWSSMFSPGTLKFLNLSNKLKLKHIVLFAITGLVLFLFFQRMSAHVRGFSIPAAIGFTGFAGMLYDLVLIFAFQVSYGYVYHWLGILITSFMFGVAVASFIMTQKLKNIKNKIRFFLWTEGFHIIYSILLVGVFAFPELFYGIAQTSAGFLKGIFLLLCFIGGFLTGFQFPLAGEIYLENLSRQQNTYTKEERKITSAASTLYGIDLLGGWVSGICGGIIFLPVLGLARTCAIIVIFKFVSFIIVFNNSVVARPWRAIK
jgi:spermidine synthase